MFTSSIIAIATTDFYEHLNSKIRFINTFKVNGPSLRGCSSSSVAFDMPAPFYKATIKTDVVGKADDGLTVYINSQFLYRLTSSNIVVGPGGIWAILTGVPSGTIQIYDIKQKENYLRFVPYNAVAVCDMQIDYSISTVTWWSE